MGCIDKAEVSTVVPHVLIFPLPIQSPVDSMLQLAELLCLAGLKVTFLNTNYNQERLLFHTNIVESRFDKYPEFRFRTTSDGLPEENPRSAEYFCQIISSLQAMAEPFPGEFLATEPQKSQKMTDNGINSIHNLETQGDQTQHEDSISDIRAEGNDVHGRRYPRHVHEATLEDVKMSILLKR
uniref:7-deoxyloganetic acid glucosyltransferase-like n=1 Tax=Nicotiana sylvestris TaxID=4096 RepID=A0A1U7W4R4_NICSY|nr:PREDICTED: 7-deoxyloganetic acid glucosyltransferase-like [Nicotiana sylvestris]